MTVLFLNSLHSYLIQSARLLANQSIAQIQILKFPISQAPFLSSKSITRVGNMSLASLPDELISHICENMGGVEEADPPNRSLKLKERAKPLMALRLTSKRIDGIASRQLFRYLVLAPKDPQSWMKVWSISRRWMATHVRHLYLEMRERAEDDPTLREKIDRLALTNLLMTMIDLSLFDNLKSLECNVWHVVRVCSIKIPRNICGFSLGRDDGQFNLWQDFASTLGNITQYGFEFRSLTLNLYYHMQWILALGLNDISNITYLELQFDARMTPLAIRSYNRLLPKIQYLPNLKKFKLDHHCHRHPENILRFLPNIVGLLHPSKRYWPSLRHLELRNLVLGRFSDLENFLSPYQGRYLTTVHISGLVFCTRSFSTIEDFNLEGHELFRWIIANILPRSNRQIV